MNRNLYTTCLWQKSRCWTGLIFTILWKYTHSSRSCLKINYHLTKNTHNCHASWWSIFFITISKYLLPWKAPSSKKTSRILSIANIHFDILLGARSPILTLCIVHLAPCNSNIGPVLAGKYLNILYLTQPNSGFLKFAQGLSGEHRCRERGNKMDIWNQDQFFAMQNCKLRGRPSPDVQAIYSTIKEIYSHWR